MQDASRASGQRWIILCLLVFGTATLTYSNIVFASWAIEAMERFSMDQMQLTAVSSLMLLPGAFFSVALGSFFDACGPRAMRFAGGAMLCVATAFVVVRAFTDSYAVLMVVTFLAGAFFLPTQVLPAKMIEAWFPHRQMGLAMGIYGSAAALGIMVSFASGAVLSGLDAALGSCAVCYGITALAWLALGRMPDGWQAARTLAADEGKALPKAGGVGRVARSRTMWLLMACTLISASGPLLLNTYMVNAYAWKGVSLAAIGSMGVLYNLSLVVGAIAAGSLATRLGRYNGVCLGFCLVGAAGTLLSFLVPASVLTFVFLFVGGFGCAAAQPLGFARVGLIPLTGEFGVENVGVAGGMNNTAMGIGPFVIPTAVAWACGNDYLAVFIVLAAGFVVMGVIGGVLLPELGEKGKLAQAAKNAASADGKEI